MRLPAIRLQADHLVPVIACSFEYVYPPLSFVGAYFHAGCTYYHYIVVNIHAAAKFIIAANIRSHQLGLLFPVAVFFYKNIDSAGS